jgi:hypothetical protein
MTHRLCFALGVMAIVGMVSGPAEAQPGRRVGKMWSNLWRKPLVVPKKGRVLLPFSRATLRNHAPFRGKTAAEIKQLLRVGKWKPSAEWLATEGKKYGVVFAFSDLHVGSGVDPATGRVAPSEDFTERHELDFHALAKRQWADASKDGRQRTLVLNGDTLEFMQINRGGLHRDVEGLAQDAFGPLNTPAAIKAKLGALAEGHSQTPKGVWESHGFFSTMMQHLINGHRIVVVPGNHDHQLMNKHVLARLTGAMVDRMSGVFVAKGAVKARAIARAQKIVAEKFELHPYFFLHGDVLFRHGQEFDSSNNHRNPIGEYYRPTSEHGQIESAMGDNVVRRVFIRAENETPWADNTSDKQALTTAVLRSLGISLKKPHKLIPGLFRLFSAVKYVLTKEGRPKGEKPGERWEQIEKDVRRYVGEFDLLRKFNEIRPSNVKALSEDQLVAKLIAYEKKTARPVYDFVKKGDGLFKRIFSLMRNVKEVVRNAQSETIRHGLTEFIHQEFYARHVYGHDHDPRIEHRIAFEDGEARAIYDSTDLNTWVDGTTADQSRNSGSGNAERRTLLVIDYDKEGSHKQLSEWDSGRQKIMRMRVLETLEDARVQ